MPLENLAIFAVSFIVGIISSMGASGGLIMFPFLLSIGMPSQLAIGTIKLGALGIWLFTYPQFSKAGKVAHEFTKSLTILAVIGGITGASIAVSVEEKTFTIASSLIILAIVTLSLLKKNLGIERVEKNKKYIYLGFFLYLAVYTLAGFFGPGSGVLIYLIMMSLLGLTILEAHGTDIIPWVILSIISAFIFAYNGHTDYTKAGIIFMATAAGGYLGSKLAIKFGDKWMKNFVLYFALICAVITIKEAKASFNLKQL